MINYVINELDLQNIENITPEVIQSSFENLLQYLGVEVTIGSQEGSGKARTDDGWTVEVTDTRKRISVSHLHRKIRIPTTRFISSLAELQRLLFEEVYIHVLRGENARKELPFHILSTGTTRSTDTEEGLAAICNRLARKHYSNDGEASSEGVMEFSPSTLKYLKAGAVIHHELGIWGVAAAIRPLLTLKIYVRRYR